LNNGVLAFEVINSWFINHFHLLKTGTKIWLLSKLYQKAPQPLFPERRVKMPTDTTEKSFESLIVESLTSEVDYVQGDPRDYDRTHAVDMVKLLGFLQSTQPETVEQLGIASEGPSRLKFLARLQGEIAKRGVVNVLRRGIRHGPVFVDLFFGTPSPGNIKAVERFKSNIFSITRQLQYSKD